MAEEKAQLFGSKPHLFTYIINLGKTKALFTHFIIRKNLPHFCGVPSIWSISFACGLSLGRRQPQPMSIATIIGYFHMTVFYYNVAQRYLILVVFSPLELLLQTYLFFFFLVFLVDFFSLKWFHVRIFFYSFLFIYSFLGKWTKK